MLAIQNKQLNSIFERIVRDKNGVLVRVRFTVVEIDGKFQGQIISAEPIVSRVQSNTCASLPKPYEKVDATYRYVPTATKSDFSFDSFFFFNSQPTRAPSL